MSMPQFGPVVPFLSRPPFTHPRRSNAHCLFPAPLPVFPGDYTGALPTTKNIFLGPRQVALGPMIMMLCLGPLDPAIRTRHPSLRFICPMHPVWNLLHIKQRTHQAPSASLILHLQTSFYQILFDAQQRVAMHACLQDSPFVLPRESVQHMQSRTKLHPRGCNLWEIQAKHTYDLCIVHPFGLQTRGYCALVHCLFDGFFNDGIFNDGIFNDGIFHKVYLFVRTRLGISIDADIVSPYPTGSFHDTLDGRTCKPALHKMRGP